MNTPSCEACNDTYEVNGESCMECCPHDEQDHFICLDCGYEGDPGEAIDAAMDYMENR